MKDQQDFNYSIVVNASAKETMKRISQVNLWWAENFKGKASNLNDEFVTDFGETYVNFRIAEIIPEKKVTWLVTDCNLHWIKNKQEWKDTEVIFNIAGKDGKTRIDFVHKGLNPECESYEACEAGWTHHLKDSLLRLINEGQGFPE